MFEWILQLNYEKVNLPEFEEYVPLQKMFSALNILRDIIRDAEYLEKNLEVPCSFPVLLH